MRHMRIQPTFSNISIHYLIKRLQKYIFGNPSTCSLVQTSLWCQWTERKGDGSAGFKLKVYAFFNASQPSCVTLTCTNLTNRKINEASAHHSSPLSAQETPAFTYCRMLASLVDLLGCQQTMHFHSHISPEPGGNIRTHCILCCESYQKTTGPPSRAHKYEIICHFPKWN